MKRPKIILPLTEDQHDEIEHFWMKNSIGTLGAMFAQPLLIDGEYALKIVCFTPEQAAEINVTLKGLK